MYWASQDVITQTHSIVVFRVGSMQSNMTVGRDRLQVTLRYDRDRVHDNGVPTAVLAAMWSRYRQMNWMAVGWKRRDSELTRRQ